jgi:hypothetical protein
MLKTAEVYAEQKAVCERTLAGVKWNTASLFTAPNFPIGARAHNARARIGTSGLRTRQNAGLSGNSSPMHATLERILTSK